MFYSHESEFQPGQHDSLCLILSTPPSPHITRARRGHDMVSINFTLSTPRPNPLTAAGLSQLSAQGQLLEDSTARPFSTWMSPELAMSSSTLKHPWLYDCREACCKMIFMLSCDFTFSRVLLIDTESRGYMTSSVDILCLMRRQCVTR